MEASTIPATAVLAPGTGSAVAPPVRRVAGPLLRLRSDEQLVRLFRGGSDEAFRVIHDRYRTRLFAYARQMLGGARADAEDVLQDVFVRAYGALRANDRDVSLRAWLYRIAHNRCIDELRRPGTVAGHGLAAPDELLELVHAPSSDPMDAVERRESLRRLVADVRRLPEQQRSALLMREISGMAYQDLATALDVTIPAVKSLLVRARIGLAQAAEARDTACAAIRADLADAHERGVRASGLVKRHLHDCKGCSAYKRELRALDTRLAALVPGLGPMALVAKLLGVVGGGGTGVAGGGATAAGGAGATAAAAGSGAAAAGAGAA
ncbi:MAG: sigma-70 family RNA polymerase sigma factor, partial [Actinobacteria bacterium]|nr:sigma-70 family RNA polymerase sigma factor [Actinomycetota bacterium]